MKSKTKSLMLRSILAVVFGVPVLITGFTTVASAAPVDVAFLPPKIDARKICISRSPDAEIIARWTSWDGKKLPAIEPALVERDLRKLWEIDANRFFGTASRIIELLPNVKPAYSRSKADQDTIRLYIAASRISDLKALGLVGRLLKDEEVQPANVQNYLADLLDEGVAVEKDVDRAMKLRVRAAIGGNADAILKLATLTNEGKTVPNWEVDPKVAVTMAFGALVGKLDSAICDRVGRIAREYGQGEIVKQDFEASEAWYRFAADLGDHNAAWSVAEMHLKSVDIKKDNTVLLKYLTLAADSGVVAAQLALGRVFEDGAIIERDLKKADAYFQRAADAGNRAGAVRQLRLTEELASSDPLALERYRTELSKMAQHEDAPGFVFTRLANLALEDKGRWAGANEAKAYLETAVQREDSDGIREYATLLLRERGNAANYEKAVDLLSGLVF